MKSSKGQIFPLAWHKALHLDLVGASGLLSVIRVLQSGCYLLKVFATIPIRDCGSDGRQQLSSGVAT